MRALIPLVLLLLVSCGAKEPASPAAAPPAAAQASLAPLAAEQAVAVPSPGSARDVEWVDPEPPDAQARAEQAVGAAWNRDKSTPLTMRITTIVDRRSGIGGFATALAARSASIDERLDRLNAKVTGQEITITLSGSVLFDFDQADIRPDAERTLSEVAEVLNTYSDRPVRIEGHTDSIASDSYNQGLSERRARSVASWLKAHGVRSSISTVGHGETRPVGDNATAAGRQQNRRVELVIGSAS